MTFQEALRKLNIEDYGERIFHSNSHGELFHLMDYCFLADYLTDYGLSCFREWFEDIVAAAEQKWKRPESIFQHILRLFNDSVKESKK